MDLRAGRPGPEQIQAAFDAIEAGKTRALIPLLYLNPQAYHDQKNPDGSGGTLVHAAVERNELACLDLLIKKQFSVLESDDEGRSPLHLARTSQAALMILQAAKEHARSMLLEQDFQGNLPHHRLAQNGHTEALICLMRVAPNNPEVIMRPNVKGDTVLHELARYAPELIPSVLSISMDVRVKNKAGETARDLCTTNSKSRTFLGAHMVLRDDAEASARETLIRQANAAEAIKAAEKAKAFVSRGTGIANFDMKP